MKSKEEIIEPLDCIPYYDGNNASEMHYGRADVMTAMDEYASAYRSELEAVKEEVKRLEKVRDDLTLGANRIFCEAQDKRMELQSEISRLRTELAGKERWINVGVELPQEEMMVLCYCPDEPIDIYKVGAYVSEAGCFVDNEDYGYWPMFWMHIKNLPDFDTLSPPQSEPNQLNKK